MTHNVKRDGIAPDGEASGNWLHAGVNFVRKRMSLDSASDGSVEFEASKHG